ncbi:MAG: hypothetical protein ACRD0F_03830, partial [Acidimicrobiales bacterium]
MSPTRWFVAPVAVLSVALALAVAAPAVLLRAPAGARATSLAVVHQPAPTPARPRAPAGPVVGRVVTDGVAAPGVRVVLTGPA